MLPGMESLACEGLAVPMDVMRHVINVTYASGSNRFTLPK